VVVVGAGSIGLGCMLLARRARAGRIVCVDQGAVKESLALRLGADQMVDTRKPDPRAELQRLLGTTRADIVIVAASFEGAFDLALCASRPGGEVNVVTYATPGVAPELNAYLRAEVTLRFSYLSTVAEFEEIVAALASGEIDPSPMVTHQLALASADLALALKARQPADVGKILLDARLTEHVTGAHVADAGTRDALLSSARGAAT
jgi:(R,R)-butanediol dehydrogenase/meso-butanediol dehydrogenase/diacetyl reductase